MPYRVEHTDRSKSISVLWVLGFMCFFQPASYAVSTQVNRIWQIYVILVSCTSLLMYLTHMRVSSTWIYIVAFFVFLYLASSIIASSDGSMRTALFRSLKCIGFVTMCEYAFRKDFKKGLLSFSVGGIVMCVIHLISWWLYKDVVGGMRSGYIEMSLMRAYETDQNWYFLTYDNNSIVYFLPVIVALWLYSSQYDSRSFFPALLVSLATLIMFVYNSAITAELVIAYLLASYALLVLWPTGLAILHIISPRYRVAVVIGLLLCSAVVISAGTSLLSSFAEWVGKDATMSGRDRIWSRSFEWVGENPLFGQGFEAVETTWFKYGHNHCHNLLVQVLYQGGTVSLTLLLLFLRSCAPEGVGEATFHVQADRIVGVGVIAFFIFATFDWVPYYPTWLAIFFFAKYLVDGSVENYGDEMKHSYFSGRQGCDLS